MAGRRQNVAADKVDMERRLREADDLLRSAIGGGQVG